MTLWHFIQIFGFVSLNRKRERKREGMFGPETANFLFLNHLVVRAPPCTCLFLQSLTSFVFGQFSVNLLNACHF